jgi:hypothetical protein
MHNTIRPKDDVLGFLDSYPSGEETIILPSGKPVEVKKYFLTFRKWIGNPIANTYGGKAVIDFNGEPLFAELAVLKLFQQNGWDGVWVDKKLYRVGLLGVPTILLPEDKQKTLDQIRSRMIGSGGCWDLFLWKDERVLFVELKKSKEDRIRDSQRQWLEVAIESGHLPSNFLFIEWILE